MSVLIPQPVNRVNCYFRRTFPAMLTAPLGKRAVAAIHSAVAALFARARVRLLGRDRMPRNIVFGPTSAVEHRHDLSLPGIFDASSSSEGFRPREDVREAATRAASTYLDAYEARAKAAAVEAVEAHVRDVTHAGKTVDPAKIRTRLHGALAEVMTTATRDVERMVQTETTGVRNIGALDGLVKVNTLAGVADPVCYFVSVRDSDRCVECTELHCLEDKVTPRCWLLSEIDAGYHRRGSGRPSMKGLHPHCRCTLASCLPGYGFNSSGSLSFIAEGFSELAKQRG